MSPLISHGFLLPQHLITILHEELITYAVGKQHLVNVRSSSMDMPAASTLGDMPWNLLLHLWERFVFFLCYLSTTIQSLA
jgi:hypothetical protein